MARISTHVLDTARGEPAQGLWIDLHFRSKLVKTAVTNTDGRTDAPLLSADRLETGVYELTFHAGDYFRATGATLTDPPFLDEVVVRFSVLGSRRQLSRAALAEPLRLQHVSGIVMPALIAPGKTSSADAVCWRNLVKSLASPPGLFYPSRCIRYTRMCVGGWSTRACRWRSILLGISGESIQLTPPMRRVYSLVRILIRFRARERSMEFWVS